MLLLKCNITYLKRGRGESSVLPVILLPDIHRLVFHLCVFLLWGFVQPRRWNRLALDNAECIENILIWCFRNMHIICISTMTIQKFSSGSWKNCLFFCVCRDFAGFVGLKVLERKHLCRYRYLYTHTKRKHIWWGNFKHFVCANTMSYAVRLYTLWTVL